MAIHSHNLEIHFVDVQAHSLPIFKWSHHDFSINKRLKKQLLSNAFLIDDIIKENRIKGICHHYFLSGSKSKPKMIYNQVVS